MSLGWGFGKGKSISVFDHLVGKPVIAEMIHGKDYSDEQMALWNKAIGSMNAPYGAARASLARALESINKGYANAESSITQQGAVATKALLDREKQNLASVKQSSIDRGIYSSTVYDAMNRGVNADTNSALGELNAQLALLGSNVRIGKGMAQAGAYNQIAGLEQNRMGYLANLGAGAAANVQQGAQGGYGGDILGMLGMIYGGGWFGAAAGAAGGMGSTNSALNGTKGRGEYGGFNI